MLSLFDNDTDLDATNNPTDLGVRWLYIYYERVSYAIHRC